MTTIVFLLPPNAREKIMFGGVSLLSNVFFIDYVGTLTEYSPSHTPLIGNLFSTFLLFFDKKGVMLKQ